MNAFRDSLPGDGSRTRYDRAMAGAGQSLADARAGRDELAARAGVEAVAGVAYVPGGPSQEQIAETYRRLRGIGGDGGST